MLVKTVVCLLQAEDSEFISGRWSMVLDNIALIIADHGSSEHVTTVAELLISQLHRWPACFVHLCLIYCWLLHLITI